MRRMFLHELSGMKTSDIFLHAQPMALLLHHGCFSTRQWNAPLSSRRFGLIKRSCLPFPPEKAAEFYEQLEAAVDVVERACQLCVDVKRSLLSSGNDGALEKHDSTPVTVADFGVQALISLELGRLFPSIPLVAEEDSRFLRLSKKSSGNNGKVSIVGSVTSAVAERLRDGSSTNLTSDDVFEAIDRGVKNDFSSNEKVAPYWILDPIDGTKGFLRGCDALYVRFPVTFEVPSHILICGHLSVGLALAVHGNVIMSVMGCPNWRQDPLEAESLKVPADRGLIMVAHVGCGTWARRFSPTLDDTAKAQIQWKSCSVDRCKFVNQACFCVTDSRTWESLPLSRIYGTKTDFEKNQDTTKVLLRPTCCGSLCKYMMVASGRASVFILETKSDTWTKVWDHASGLLCVHEAGGQVTDWEGNQLDLAVDEVHKRMVFPSGGVLVTNGILHRQILELISKTS